MRWEVCGPANDPPLQALGQDKDNDTQLLGVPDPNYLKLIFSSHYKQLFAR